MTQNKPQKSQPKVDPCDVPSTPYETALAEILSHIKTLQDTQRLPIREALHGVAAETVISKQNIPNQRNSAMDGYACRFQDLAEAGQLSQLKVVGTSAAGNPYDGTTSPGDCIRILTGGVMPDELDTIIMQEDCELQGQFVVTRNTHKIKQHVRDAGDDVKKHDAVVSKGQPINMAELGLLATIGCESILVYRKPTVAFFSTGDELRGVGESLKPGDVYDSNRYTIHALLQQMHVDSIDLGVIRDNLSDTIDALAQAAKQSDLVISTAGASVGDSDYVKRALEQMGELKLWKVAMKPGRPLAFGKINNAWFFGLPGNPVSVVVTFDKFVQPAIKKLRGEKPTQRLRLRVRCETPIIKTPGRLEYQRGILSYNYEGDLVVSAVSNQSSGVLSSMVKANCYIVLPLETGNIDQGSLVVVEPFSTEL